MGSDYIIEEEQEKIEEYKRDEIAKNAAILALTKKIPLEDAARQATELQEMQDDAINSNSKEAINIDDTLEFLTSELQDPSSDGLNEQQIYVLKNKILDQGLIN